MYRLETDGRAKRLMSVPAAGARQQGVPALYRLNAASYGIRTARLFANRCLVDPGSFDYAMAQQWPTDTDPRADLGHTEWLLAGERAV